jgi:hypothetical protein
MPQKRNEALATGLLIVATKNHRRLFLSPNRLTLLLRPHPTQRLNQVSLQILALHNRIQKPMLQ